MKKGQIIEGIVQRVDFPCKGIVETEDGICVVKNALPGQKIKCVVNKARRGKAEGRLLEVLKNSPTEIESPCPHFGICGSCVYLSLPYGEQLKIKEAQVKKLLDSVLCKPMKIKNPESDEQSEQVEGTEQPELLKKNTYRFEGIKPSPVCYGYRNKMEFTFGDEVKDGPLSLGMHKRGSFYDIVSVESCRIVDEDYRQILKCVREYFTKLQAQEVDITFYHRLRHTGYLRHLLVRKAAKTGEILIALVTTTQIPQKEGVSDVTEGKVTETVADAGHSGSRTEEEILQGLKQELLNLQLDGKIVGILHTKNDSLADVVQSDETILLYGQDYFYEELLGLKFKISQFSFFQTNSLGAEVLYQTARDYIMDFIRPETSETVSTNADEKELQADKIVFDLYSGTGTIAQLMAPVAKKVIGVEIVEEAVEAARKNAELNGLHNCEFVTGDVLKVIDEIDEKPDIIILDPPRDGIHPKALNKIIRYGVEHILYISCKPTSLVRDLEAFLERGYQVERAVAVDMFPWTSGVETVVLLSKGDINSEKLRVEFSLEDMDMSGFRKGATYQEIKDYVKEQTGLSVSSLYIAQMKRKCGLDVGQNYNLAKKENAKVPQCPQEKEEAIRAALKNFNMI